MKKTLLFIFVANLFFAQNSELLNTNWQITKIVGEISPTEQVPPAMPYQQVTTFSNNPSSVSLSFFNIVSASLTYTGQNSFTINEKACTLADYWGDNGQVNQFFGSLCNFFIQGSNYYYNIVNTGSEKTLTIGNAIFQEIHFKSVNLGVKDQDKPSPVVLAPNPVKNNLNVTSTAEIVSAKIFDSSGKLIYDKNNENAKTLNIDLRNFKTGTYFIQINGKETYKIIKE